MSGYKIVNHQKIEAHITFIRITPTDIALTLKEVFDSLADLAWISQFDKPYLRDSFKKRAQLSVDYIAEKIIKSGDDKITSDSGEYVISELARKALVSDLKYLDIPLAELIKGKKAVNHGFDFYSKNLSDVLPFGEAKYLFDRNAYGSSFEQIARFITNEQDIIDIVDIQSFCCESSKTNFSKGEKGFVAAFASKKTSTEKLIAGIKENKDYLSCSKFHELICVAVDI